MPRLLEEGDDFDAKDESGQTALRQAVFNGRDVMTLLLEKGANVHAEDDAEDDAGGTALNWIARIGQYAVVSLLLLDKGANIDARDGAGETTLYWAATNGHEAVVQLLVEKRADGEAAGGDGGQHL